MTTEPPTEEAMAFGRHMDNVERDLNAWVESVPTIEPPPNPAPTRGRGRPTTGQRIDIRIPADVLAEIDVIARNHEWTRAETIRGLIAYGAAAQRLT